MKFSLVSGTGNVFALFDGFQDELPADPAAAARELCSADLAALAELEPAISQALRLDGVLLLLPPRDQGDCRMVVHNADGSRPESCGTGLRCVALIARERGHVSTDSFCIESDAGLKAASVLRDEQGKIVGARIAMGEPSVGERRITLKTGHGALEVSVIDMGNPHCVLFVKDEQSAPVAKLGAELERHRHFPARTNVEFVRVTPAGLSMRVWERGVGETAACGTGACAAAVAAVITQRASTPLDVRLPGGVLHIEWQDASGEVHMSGGCEQLATGVWHSALSSSSQQGS
jgi:diaminopimelate epimerase